MPLLYGEGAKAFQRLQEEIMKQLDDQSIFAWSQTSIDDQNGAILTPSPAHFKDCGEITRSVNKSAIKPYTVTNKGLHAEFQVLGHGNEVIAILNCRYSHDFFCNLGLPLRKHDEGQYRRIPGSIRKVPIAYWTRGRLQPMYVKMAAGNFASRNDPSNGSCLLRNLPKEYFISDIVPSYSSVDTSRASSFAVFLSYHLYFGRGSWPYIFTPPLVWRMKPRLQSIASENSLQRLKAWENSNRGNARYIWEDFVNMLPLPCLIPVCVLYVCLVHGVDGAVTTLAVIATFGLTFFGIQAYRWGDWIWGTE